MTLAELNEIKKNYKILEIAVDFINPSYNISRAKRLDNARYIVCTLTENGVPRSVKENEVARIRLQKPDKTYIYNDCDIIEDGRVLITLTEQILAVEGNAVCDIQLTDEETGIIYSTKNFIINIDKTAVDNSVIESSYEFDALNNLITTNKKIADIITKKVNDAINDLQEKLDNHHFVLTEDKDISGGVPSLDSNSKVPIVELYDATITNKGITQLTDSVKSTSITTAATPNSVKITYDAVTTSDSTIVTNDDIDALFI